MADLKDTLLCMSAEVAARSRSLRRSNTEESFSDILPAVDATGRVGFGNRRAVEDGVGSEADSVSVYSTDSGVVLAKEGEDEKRVADSLVFDKSRPPTGLLLNVETLSVSSLPETPAEVSCDNFDDVLSPPHSKSIPFNRVTLLNLRSNRLWTRPRLQRTFPIYNFPKKVTNTPLIPRKMQRTILMARWRRSPPIQLNSANGREPVLPVSARRQESSTFSSNSGVFSSLCPQHTCLRRSNLEKPLLRRVTSPDWFVN